MKKIVCLILCILLLMTSSVSASILSGGSIDVSIDVLQDGKAYLAEELKNVAVISGGATKLELYVDGILVKDSSASSMMCDLSGIATGKRTLRAVGSNEANDTGFYETSIIVTEQAVAELYSTDMSDRTVGTFTEYNSVTNITGHGETGYQGFLNVPESSSNIAAVVGITNTKNSEKTNKPWIGFDGKSKKRLIFKADIYIDKQQNFDFYLRGSNGGISSVDVKLTSGQIQCTDKTTGNVGKFSYAEKTWYTITYIINAEAKTYSFMVKPAGGTSETVLAENAGMSNANFDYVTNIRPEAPNTDNSATFMALDNVCVSEFSDMPYIVSAETSGGIVEKDADCINLKFSGNINISSLSIDDISINSGKVESFEAGETPDTLKVHLKNRLLSDKEYILKIDTGIKSGSTEISVPTAAYFKTQAADIEYTSASMTGTSFSCTLKDNSGSGRSVYLIESIFSGSELKDVKVEKIDFTAGTANVNYTAAPGGRIMIVDGVTNAVVVSQKCFVCE